MLVVFVSVTGKQNTAKKVKIDFDGEGTHHIRSRDIIIKKEYCSIFLYDMEDINNNE